jgi:hypothetical protein
MIDEFSGLEENIGSSREINGALLSLPLMPKGMYGRPHIR